MESTLYVILHHSNLYPYMGKTKNWGSIKNGSEVTIKEEENYFIGVVH